MAINLLSLIPLYLKYEGKVQNAWNLATSNREFIDIIEREIPILADIAANVAHDIAPQAEPKVRAAIQVALTFNRQLVMWGQRAINAAANAGLITLPAPLEVDGMWGPKTAAGFKALQEYAKSQGINILADGFLGKLSEAVIKQLGIPGIK